MRKISALIIIISFFLPFPSVFSQGHTDNTYGEYLLSANNKLISMDLAGADLTSVLKALSQQSGLNFVSSEAVKQRKVTLYFDGVPLKDAMNTIFKANNLTYDFYPDANIFIVKEMGKPKVELITKVYRLKYTRVIDSRMQEEIDDLLEGTGTEGIGASAGSSSSSESESSGGDDYGIVKAVEDVLTEYGKVTEDDVTNSLVVTDVPSQFPVIDKVVAGLDIPKERVLIEVEMLDVSKRLIDQLGFNYANGLTASFTPGTMTTPFPFPKRLITGAITRPLLDPVASGTLPAMGITSGVLDLRSFTTVMKFLSTDTTTKFLARPKILTLSNETAEFNLTTDAAIGVTTTTTEGGNTTQEVERAEIGTKLRVTPQVNGNTGEVTMFVEVFSKENTDSGLVITGLSSGQLQNPEERGAKTVVRLKDGETLLIGGLIRNNDSDAITKIPFLGDIPILGHLFRYKNKDKQERELLVFLTPHIIKDPKSIYKKRANIASQREQDFTFHKDSVNLALDRYAVKKY